MSSLTCARVHAASADPCQDAADAQRTAVLREFVRFVRSAFACAALIGVAPHARRPAPTLAQPTYRAWTIRDGAPAPLVVLAQSSDGRPWVGTTGRLYTFIGCASRSSSRSVGSACLHGASARCSRSPAVRSESDFALAARACSRAIASSTMGSPRDCRRDSHSVRARSGGRRLGDGDRRAAAPARRPLAPRRRGEQITGRPELGVAGRPARVRSGRERPPACTCCSAEPGVSYAAGHRSMLARPAVGVCERLWTAWCGAPLVPTARPGAPICPAARHRTTATFPMASTPAPGRCSWTATRASWSSVTGTASPSRRGAQGSA